MNEMPQRLGRRRGSLPAKLAIAAIVLAVLGWLFIRSLHSTRAEPYAVERGRLEGWTLAVEPASEPAAPLVVLRGPQELVSGLFRQVFTRMMESLNAPAAASITRVLRGEFDRGLAGAVTMDALLEAAREAGLEGRALEPRCLAHRRTSQPGATRQVYFAVFESPAFDRFRDSLAARAAAHGSEAGFDPAALSPVMFVAGSDAVFHRWLPLVVDTERDCVASIDVR
jgi:hypothetical protein